MKDNTLSPGPRTKRVAIAGIVAIIAIAVVVSISAWPDLYGFATERDGTWWERLLSTPVHLSDDVMISLRSGSILGQTGHPAFNRQDLAQASTSYAAPYLYALLSKFFAVNVAVLLYAFLGMLSVALTASIIYLYSRSGLNALVLMASLLLSTTSIKYSLQGWDHLFQALFLVIGASLFLRTNLSRTSLVSISSCLAIACLWRPDALLFSLVILACLFREIRKKRDWLFFGVLPFIAVLLPFLIEGITIFGHITPTTARLKVGASPSIAYSIQYLIKNGLMQFSAITLVVALAIVYVAFLARSASLRCHALVLSAMLTSLISAINSDHFIAGRMFWGSACVLAVVCSSLAPPIASINQQASIEQPGRARMPRVDKLSVLFHRTTTLLWRPLLVALSLIAVICSGSNIVQRTKSAVVSIKEVPVSATASQYVLTRWIDQHLDPANGPIGFFYLGLSFHLDRFEIADFLGKADELIARSRVNWGPPGHNKWDISATLEKWNPQAIVPAEPSDFSDRDVLARARGRLMAREDFGFAPALIINPRVSNGYYYCHVRPFRSELKDEWGLFLRKDIAKTVGDAATCRESAWP